MRGCSVVEIKGRAERLTGEEAERLTSGRDTAMSEVERRGKGRGAWFLQYIGRGWSWIWEGAVMVVVNGVRGGRLAI
jgi:hypothetical protein